MNPLALSPWTLSGLHPILIPPLRTSYFSIKAENLVRKEISNTLNANWNEVVIFSLDVLKI